MRGTGQVEDDRDQALRRVRDQQASVRSPATGAAPVIHDPVGDEAVGAGCAPQPGVSIRNARRGVVLENLVVLEELARLERVRERCPDGSPAVPVVELNFERDGPRRRAGRRAWRVDDREVRAERRVLAQTVNPRVRRSRRVPRRDGRRERSESAADGSRKVRGRRARSGEDRGGVGDADKRREKRPELAGTVRREGPPVRGEKRDHVWNVELPPGGERARYGRSACAGSAGRRNVDEEERRVGGAPVHRDEIRRVVRGRGSEHVEDDRRLNDRSRRGRGHSASDGQEEREPAHDRSGRGLETKGIRARRNRAGGAQGQGRGLRSREDARHGVRGISRPELERHA